MRHSVILIGAGALLLAGCSPEWYRDDADKEVYTIVEQKRKPLVSEERREVAFSIEPELVAVDAVGASGLLEDFRGTPPPEPEQNSVDVDELIRRAGLENVELEGEAGEKAPEGTPETPSAEPQGPESEAPGAPEGAEVPRADAAPVDPDRAMLSLEPDAESRAGVAEGQEGVNPAGQTPEQAGPTGGGADAGSQPASATGQPGEQSTEGQPGQPAERESSQAAEGQSEQAGQSTGEQPGQAPDEGQSEQPGQTTQEQAGEGQAGEGQAGVPPAGDQSEEGASVAATIAEMIARTPRYPARMLSLDDALRLAFANNRDYQSQKEAVYLQVLTLTLVRWQFAPRFFGVVTGEWNTDADGSESGRITSRLGFTKLFASGARLSISALNNLFQFFTGDRREQATTILDGSLTQPLLRGFGGKIVLEPLTQAERNAVYQLRAFERFRKTFAFSVMSEYYRVVQNIDQVHNAYLNWQSQVNNLERSEALAEAQRMARIDLDQVRQAELQAHDSWIAAVTSYENSLDRFKITLGIDVEASIALDHEELTRLAETEVGMVDVSVEDAIDLAFEHRLDLQTARETVEDAERAVGVAADLLRAQLDVTGSASLESGTDNAEQPFKFNTGNFAYGVGFDLDLPLDRKAERNTYVRSLIAFEREKRDYSLFEDEIILTVRDEYRVLEREIVRYGIQKASLELNEFRVDSSFALRDAGQATARDVNDALDDLNNARNALTSSLVNFTLARIALFRDLGVLQVNSGNRVIEPDLAALIARQSEKAGEDDGKSDVGDVSSKILPASGGETAAVTR